MSRPDNPFEIIIKNKFFPNGLTEQNIYDYWMKNKIDLLTYLRGKRSIYYLSDKNQNIIVRRYVSKDVPIKLTDLNFDKIITGRTIGLLEVFEKKSTWGIVDIDSPKHDEEISSGHDFELVKEMTSKIYNFLSRSYKCTILYTGKNGFHINCTFEKGLFMDRIKDMLKHQLESKTELKPFVMKKSEQYPTIDLSPNMVNGATIISGSLNKIGLPAVFVSKNELESFNREKLIDRVVSK